MARWVLCLLLCALLLSACSEVWNLPPSRVSPYPWKMTRAPRPDTQVMAPEGPPPLVPLEQLVDTGLGRDGVPPIDHPKFVSAHNASAFVPDATLGLLVKAGNQTRFYPYNILAWHEIVNDHVGGVPLAITYCRLCASGIVYERRPEGRTLDFGNSGKVYESNLVMYDRQTGTYWSQMLGLAIVGPLTGGRLELYPSALVKFQVAKSLYPTLQVLSTDTGAVRHYQQNPYAVAEESDELVYPVSRQDTRLRPKTLIHAIWVEGTFKAYGYDKLQAAKILDDVVGGHALRITVGDDSEIRVQDSTAGRRIVGVTAYWFAWSTHHPGAEMSDG